MTPSPNAPWSGLRPDDVRSLLESTPVRWWLCGGWAIDHWLGRQTRPHEDIDIGCFRDDVPALCAHLEAWEIFVADAGTLTRLDPARSVVEVTSLWCRRVGRPAWDLQVMIEEADAELWYFRRDRAVSRHKDDVTWRDRSGSEALRPEIQILYKAKSPRPKDEADLRAVVPTLDAGARGWLGESLGSVHPGHAWLDVVTDHGGPD